ncbi:unnamed protein product [Dibothriocephalus latus]|uniref:Adenosylmethionine decarboxylase n=1 Tax=Dibothriocephalus latus TaxID=60516 RepID=A0A3P6PT16_DIBLA|nr:unnamed protein product [Dibothriocephalus latus]
MTVNMNGGQSDHIFEGTEKLLEMWFFGPESDIHGNRAQIRHILDLARCTVLAEIHNEFQILFLSESSLFITRNRIILKTCGKTTLLKTLEPLTEFAYELGFTKYVLYYSRRSYLFPELQPPLQRDFSNEVSVYIDRKHADYFAVMFRMFVYLLD